MTANAPARGPSARSRHQRPETFGSGLLPGTLLLTQDGEIPVEFLNPGDRVITRDAGLVRVDAVSRFTRRLAAVRFAAGTLGANRPDQDLILPAGQPVLVRDWRARALFGRSQAMVRAAALIDDEFITRLDARDMTLHQLHFARAHVIYAGGLELGCGDDLSLARAA